jgi:hypothetical protein
MSKGRYPLTPTLPPTFAIGRFSGHVLLVE